LIISKIHRYQIITIKLALLHTIIKKSFIDPRVKRFEYTYLAHIDKQYDDIYMFRTNSGEVYFFLLFALIDMLKTIKAKIHFYLRQNLIIYN
ncbi:hypothetical protein, partial [Helicobacter typhlonius]